MNRTLKMMQRWEDIAEVARLMLCNHTQKNYVRIKEKQEIIVVDPSNKYNFMEPTASNRLQRPHLDVALEVDLPDVVTLVHAFVTMTVASKTLTLGSMSPSEMLRGVRRTPESARAYMQHLQLMARDELYKQASNLEAWEVQEVSEVLFMDGMTIWHGAAPPRMESFRSGLLEIKLLIPLVIPSMERIYKNLDYGAAYGQNPLIPGCKELSSAAKFAIQHVDIFAHSVSNGQRKNIVREMQLVHGVPFRALELINSAYTDIGDQLAAHKRKVSILAERYLRDHQPDTT